MTMDSRILQLILQARDEVSDVVGGIGDSFERNRKKIGVAMTAAGAAVTGFAVIATKAALEEQIGIDRLAAALARSGTSYEAQRGQIEATIRSLQTLTNFGDGEQRQVLERLISLTGDYESSLAALPAVLDTATALQMDATAVAQLVARAFEGQTGALTRYGIELEEGATRQDVLNALMARFGGSAAAAVNPITQLGNEMGDIVELIGGAFLPILQDAVDVLRPILMNIQQWIEANPALARTIILAVAGLGALMAVLGPLLLILPGIGVAIGVVGGALALLLSPVGLVIGAIVALALAVSTNFLGIRDFIGNVVNRVMDALNFLIRGVETTINAIIRGWNRLAEWLGWETLSEVTLPTVAEAFSFIGEKIGLVVDKAFSLINVFDGQMDRSLQTAKDGLSSLSQELGNINDNLEETEERLKKTELAMVQFRARQAEAALRAQAPGIQEAVALAQMFGADPISLAGFGGSIRGAIGLSSREALPLGAISEALADIRAVLPGASFDELQRLLLQLLPQRGSFGLAGLGLAPLMDNGGLIRGPGLFAVGAGVTEIARTPGNGGQPQVNIYGDIYGFEDFERKVGEAQIRLRRRGADV